MDSRIAERSSSAALYDLARFADTPQCLAIQTNQQKLISSFDLSSKAISISERVMGIEPTYQAWEARVLPLNYTRFSGVDLEISWMCWSNCQSRP